MRWEGDKCNFLPYVIYRWPVSRQWNK